MAKASPRRRNSYQVASGLSVPYEPAYDAPGSPTAPNRSAGAVELTTSPGGGQSAGVLIMGAADDERRRQQRGRKQRSSSVHVPGPLSRQASLPEHRLSFAENRTRMMQMFPVIGVDRSRSFLQRHQGLFNTTQQAPSAAEPAEPAALDGGDGSASSAAPCR